MNRILALALVAGVAACSKKAPTTTPEPNAGAAQPAAAPTPAPAPPPASSGGGMDAAAAAERNRLLAVLQTPIHFDYDKDDIKPEDQPILDAKAAILKANPGLRIRISGHCDERGSDEYNLVLGNKRALAAKRYLENKGVDGGRIDVTSFGEEHPVDPASNETAWAKNRRDEFEIVAGGDRLVSPR